MNLDISRSGEVLIIMLTEIMAASEMKVARGVNFFASAAERILQINPKQVTFVAPLVTYGFTFASGMGHIVYPLWRRAHWPIDRNTVFRRLNGMKTKMLTTGANGGNRENQSSIHSGCFLVLSVFSVSSC
jgi:hypothetical protein